MNLTEHQTRQHLLTQLQTQQQHLAQIIEKFYSQRSHPEAGDLQAIEEMIAAFDRVIAAGDWESSLFLRNTIKPLRQMREEAIQTREQLRGNVKNSSLVMPVLTPGMIKVYIAIFQYKAHSSKDWEAQLRALPSYILGRPIYRDERMVQQALRAKLTQNADAYVCVGVLESFIQSGASQPAQTDKHGNPLLQLLPGAVKSENILEFVYQNKRYYFVDGKLVEIN